MNPYHVIYHGNCMDGFAAAWVVRKWYADEMVPRTADPVSGITYEPAQYQQEFNEAFYERYVDKQLIIVDFSFPPEVMLKLLDYCDNITWIDHHKSAVEAVLAVPDLVTHPLFTKYHSMDHSGAMLTWMWFFGDSNYPQLLRYVEDRDLWRFSLPGCKAIVAAVFSYAYHFETYDMLMGMSSEDMLSLEAQGNAINRKHFKDIHENLNTSVRWMRIGGVDMPVINCPKEWGSDAAHILAETSSSGMAAYYWDSPDSRNFGLRSIGDSDVSVVAKVYGGGGHKNAAGFKVDPERAYLIDSTTNNPANKWSKALPF